MIDPRKILFNLALLWLLTTTSSCAWLSSVWQSTYREDLSRHRKVLAAPSKDAEAYTDLTPAHHSLPNSTSEAVTEQLNALLEIKKRADQAAKHIPGFTIQVYTGGSREKAFEARNKVYEHYPYLEPKISYNATNYMVRAGSFLEKLEAYKVHMLIIKHFPRAIIRPAVLPNKAHIFSRITTAETLEEASPSNDINEQ